MTSGTRLPGRDAECELLQACLDAGGGVVLVGGTPGLGVSSLLRYARSLAGERGLAVHAASAVPLDRERPMSTLASWLPASAPTTRDGWGVAAAADAVVTAWTVGGPAVVVLDDLHLADDASLLTVRAAAERLGAAGVLLVGGYHLGLDDGRVEASLGSVATVVRLAPLAAEAAGRLLADRLASPCEALLDLCRGSGNAWLLARAADTFDGSLGTFGAEMVEHALRLLPGEDADLAIVAAATEGVATLGVLSEVVGKPVDQIRGRLAVLRAAGILRRTREEIAFADPLLGLVLRQAVDPDLAARTLDALDRSGLHRRRLAAVAPEAALTLARDDSLTRAQALLWSGRHVAARDLARAGRTTARDPATQLGLAEILALAHLANGDVDRAHAVLEEYAGSAVADGLRAMTHNLRGEFDLAAVLAAEVVDSADPTAQGYGLLTLAGQAYLTRRLDTAIEALDHLDALLAIDEDPIQRLTGVLLRVSCLRADEAVGRLVEDAEPLARQVAGSWYPWWEMVRALVHYNRGRWDLAEAGLAAATKEGDLYGLAQPLHGLATILAIHRGDLATARREHELARLAAADTRGMGLFYLGFPVLAEALVAEADGRVGDALELVRPVIGGAVGVHTQSTLTGIAPRLVRMALAADDPQLAEEITAGLEAAGDDVRLEAMLARALVAGDPERLLAAAEELADSDSPLEAAWAGEEAARALAKAGRHPDARAAFEPTAEQLRRLNALGDLRRAEARLRDEGLRLGVRGPRNRARSGWPSLTPAELRIAQLVAEGLSNPDIARALHVSPRTVQTHVSRILAKLGLGSRVEVAAAAARQS